MIMKKYVVLMNAVLAQYTYYFFVTFFIISISISSVFIYFHWHLKRKYIETTIYWMQFCWTYKWEILSKLILKIVHITFLIWLILKGFDSSLIKIDKKNTANIFAFIILAASQEKNLMIMKTLIV